MCGVWAMCVNRSGQMMIYMLMVDVICLVVIMLANLKNCWKVGLFVKNGIPNGHPVNWWGIFDLKSIIVDSCEIRQ